MKINETFWYGYFDSCQSCTIKAHATTQYLYTQDIYKSLFSPPEPKTYIYTFTMQEQPPRPSSSTTTFTDNHDDDKQQQRHKKHLRASSTIFNIDDAVDHDVITRPLQKKPCMTLTTKKTIHIEVEKVYLILRMKRWDVHSIVKVDCTTTSRLEFEINDDNDTHQHVQQMLLNFAAHIRENKDGVKHFADIIDDVNMSLNDNNNSPSVVNGVKLKFSCDSKEQEDCTFNCKITRKDDGESQQKQVYVTIQNFSLLCKQECHFLFTITLDTISYNDPIIQTFNEKFLKCFFSTSTKGKTDDELIEREHISSATSSSTMTTTTSIHDDALGEITFVREPVLGEVHENIHYYNPLPPPLPFSGSPPPPLPHEWMDHYHQQPFVGSSPPIFTIPLKFEMESQYLQNNIIRLRLMNGCNLSIRKRPIRRLDKSNIQLKCKNCEDVHNVYVHQRIEEMANSLQYKQDDFVNTMLNEFQTYYLDNYKCGMLLEVVSEIRFPSGSEGCYEHQDRIILCTHTKYECYGKKSNRAPQSIIKK